MRRTDLSLLVLILAITACKKAEPPPPPAETNVELVERGGAPHKTLRYHIAKGTRTTLDVGIDASVVGRSAPSIVTTMSFVGDDVLPDGRMIVRSTVEHTAAKTADGAPVPAEMTSVFDGISIVATISSVGTLTDARVDLAGKQLPPQLATQVQSLTKSFEQVAMVLPNGPVGVGASWRTRKTIEQNHVQMTAVTTITLLAIDGDKVTFTRRSQITGPDQTLSENGMTIALKNLVGTGTASGTIDLGKFATTSEATDEYHADVFDPAAADKTPEKLGVSMKMTMTPK